MQELEIVREKIQNKYRVVKTDEDLEWNRAIDLCTNIINAHLSRGNTPEFTRSSRDNDGWISVEERMPKAGEHVLVSFRSAGFLPATAIISENGRWSMLQGAKGFNDVTKDVIAWRPLPEPYRPKKESEGSRRLREREEFFKG